MTIISYWIFYNNTNFWAFDKKEILSTIISVISIIIAIIVTYLFSKLFAEITVKLERKKAIDKLSNKITYLRRIAFQIRGLREFWQFNDKNIKSIIDSKYKDLTYEEYRSYEIPGHRKLSYDELKQINKDIYETDGQAYLALKGLEDGENSFLFFCEFNPKNYSLEDIARYKEYSSSFNYLLDRSDDKIVNFNSCSDFYLGKINELYFKILGKNINTSDYKNDIKNLFTEFDSVIFEKHSYLTNLNSAKLSIFYKNGLFNMTVFLLILIFSVFVFVLDSCKCFDFISTISILSLFIANTIDLILITFQSIKKELRIEEINI